MSEHASLIFPWWHSFPERRPDRRDPTEERPFEGALIPITFDTLQEANGWAQVAVEDYRRLDAYLRSIEPDLPEHYGMSVDGVRFVIERLRGEGIDARSDKGPTPHRADAPGG